MFSNCQDITEIDLSNFNTSKVTYMSCMFYYCSQLTSIDLSNFDTSQVTYMNSMFSGCSQLTSIDLSNFDTSKVTDMEYMFAYCSQLKYINLKNFTENSNLNVYDMFYNVSNNVIVCLDISNTKILTELNSTTNYILNCSYVFETKETEIITETEISKIETELIITTNQITTEISKIEETGLIITTNQIKNVIDNIIKNQAKGKTKEEETKYYDNILKILRESFTSENFNTSDIDNGKEEKIETEKMKITITTTENQKNNINNNTTIVDLGNCEKELKKYYNISNESLLYMIKLEINQDGMKIPKIEYEYFQN